ncbi:MAG: 2-isopropylmalate synthase [Rhodothermia bacterium]
MSERVFIFDTTLRDGEQAPGASMSVQDKLEVAGQLALMGVDVIEAGFPVSSPAQFEAVRTISESVEGPTICGLARAMPKDIDAAAAALAPARKARIHTFIATSDIHIEAKFESPRYGKTLDEKRETIIKMAVESIHRARAFTDDIEFSAEDAGRTNREFLCRIIRAAVEAGATVINIPDTTGYCVPSEYAKMFKTVREKCGITDDVVLSTHCHDDLGLATANTLAAVNAGARQVECTINGIGERAGNAALEEIVMSLNVRGDRFGLTTGVDTRLLTPTSKMVSLYCGSVVQPNKAIVGRNAFCHEAGIHQDGVLKLRETYEIMRAEDVGQEAEAIRLGRHSGRHGFFTRLDRLGLPFKAEDREALYDRFVELADKKKEIFDDDLVHLVNQGSDFTEQHVYDLENWDVSVGDKQKPSAAVRVKNLATGVVVMKEARGDGPVHALYKAIDRAVGEAHKLTHFEIRSASEGADALGEVSVTVAFEGKTFDGKASRTDVLKASADAYLRALNRLANYKIHEGDKSLQWVGDSIMSAFDGPA